MTPAPRERRGRPALDDAQRRLHDLTCIWGLRLFHMARAIGRSSQDAHTLLARHATLHSAESTLTIGRQVCPTVAGWEAGPYAESIQQQMRALLGHDGLDQAEVVLADAAQVFGHLGYTYRRAMSRSARLYDACHGGAPGELDEKIIEAILPPAPSEEHFSLPVATRISLISGVNLAFLWPAQWYYRFVMQTAAALTGWTRADPATLHIDEYYVLYRCAVTASPLDPTQHGWVKRFLTTQIETSYAPRDHFIEEAEEVLRKVGLLPNRPRTLVEMLRRCLALVDEEGDEPVIEMMPRPLA